MAYDLSISGYQAVDIGHIDIEYEWFLQKAADKELVKNKYIGEISGGNEVGEIKDLNDENEIIAKVLLITNYGKYI
ncbi:hypothetical protein BLL40_07450 [Domibacillus mangrovi]|uniref:Glycosyltransferase GT-D fold domain-containing protein n=1 Tax=Domibacillus mangrovi TaxID=1714354 RepID=A0A1Q5P2W2_9BACI|nr:hypothetical protein BLL40_07450 [Domibacillus mangrovi]